MPIIERFEVIEAWKKAREVVILEWNRSNDRWFYEISETIRIEGSKI
ncbi:MAG: hypothetical protein ACR2M8_05985 [Pyrinomonadaceae bacterium]|nr:hypothetical protein [Blastocatellia bacterium]MDQ3220102.1 hypothetical protein [Acidobacteriota bacterium]MDQ3491541.1 hypothetical protein [Acidobacteriota bacterium]